MPKLYISEHCQTCTEVAGVALGNNLRTIKKVSLKSALSEYDKTCTAHKCLKNQSNERLYFGLFTEFMAGREIFNVGEIQRRDLEAFESSLLKTGMKASSVNRRFSSIKHFFVKCREWDFILENPCLGIKKRTEEDNPFKPWPLALFIQFLLLTTGVHTDLFYFLWLTGARPMEAKNLRWTDIDYEAGFLTLRCGKGSKDGAMRVRKIPISDEISKILHQIRMDSLFVFSKNKIQINNDLLYHYCKDRLKFIGGAQYTVYGLRHTFGSRINAEGASSFDTQNLMGHSKMETSKKYIHHDLERLKKILS